MKINLPVYYEVDKNEQIVVARFKKPYFDCANYFNLHSATQRVIAPLYDYINLDDLEGVAKCFMGDENLGKPGDKYDVEFGKKLAKTRLIKNFYRRLKKYYEDVAKGYEQDILELKKFRDKAYQKSINCYKHEENLVEKTKQQ